MRKVYLFFLNAALMTAASVFIQIISVIFNVYLTKTAGAEGIGLYYLVLSVYGLSVTVATSGITLTATRLVSENNRDNRRKIVNTCFSYALFFGIIAFCILFFNAKFIGCRFLHDKRTVLPLRLLSLSMPFIAMSSVINGYFTAMRCGMKVSVIQVFEFLAKLGLTVFLLKTTPLHGTNYTCAAIFGGGAAGEILSFTLAFIMYSRDVSGIPVAKTRFLRKIVSIAMPIAVSTYIRSGLNMLKQVLVPAGLQKSGTAYKKALSDYGTINGMAMQIICFPMNILYSCSNLLIPELAENSARGNKKQIRRIVSKAMRTTSVFAVVIFVLCLIFADDIGKLIYKSCEAGRFIRLLSPVILTMYIDAVTDGMLKGLDLQMYSMKYNIIDSALSVVLLLVLLPRFGISGYLAVIYTSEILNTALSIRRLIKAVFC